LGGDSPKIGDTHCKDVADDHDMNDAVAPDDRDAGDAVAPDDHDAGDVVACVLA